MADKEILFSLTRNDFEIQTFCTGGNGGQHRNAKQNGVRIIHKASGARAEHRDGRDQVRNKEAAFEKLAKTPVFLAWHRAEVGRRLGIISEEEKLRRSVEAAVDKQMRDEYLRVEMVGQNV